jgi:hypothetical protein
MAGTGFFIDNFSSARFSKSLCSSPICFYLWHINFSFGFNFYRIYVKIDGVSIDEFRLTPPEKSINWNYARLALPSVFKTA